MTKHDVSYVEPNEEKLKTYDLPFTKFFTDKFLFLRYIPCCSCYRGIACTCCDKNKEKTVIGLDKPVSIVELGYEYTMKDGFTKLEHVINGSVDISDNISEGLDSDDSLKQANTKL